ncbi:hypothetical protein JL721_1471 [Aureococcus anophagefferens]|nr:hypothetical protein JL721_1471 [Aureococcus anophagefferens]
MRAWYSIIIFFVWGLAPKASGQELAKLVASDAAAYDRFGESVAISGDLVVVGAYWNADAGYDSGSAYVFRTTNDGASWTQVAKLVASDAAAGDDFGESVAVSGDLVVVGAHKNDDAGDRSGSAYVFRTTNDGASWTQVAKLVASDAAEGDFFGYSVAVGGDLVVVGAHYNDDAGSSSGSAYVFRTTNDGTTWSETAKLVASDAAEGDFFGESVAVGGDLVVVGAPYNDDAGSTSGSAYVFQTTNDGASWTQVAKLVASDAAAFDYFGTSVAVSGDLVVVGAHYNDDAGDCSGSAYVFRTTNDGASWTQVAKLVASDAAEGDFFGESVAVGGDLVVVGAPYNDDAGFYSGSAYVFGTTNGGASWTQVAKLLASDAAEDDEFGWSVAVSGDLVVVGAHKNDDAGDSSGSAYVWPPRLARTSTSAPPGSRRRRRGRRVERAAASTKTPATKTPAPSARYQQLMRESEGVVARGMTAASVLLAAGA